MTPKKLDPDSIYAKYDINNDGTVSDEEIKRHQELIELELREEKSEAQKTNGMGCYGLYDYRDHFAIYSNYSRYPCYCVK